MIFRKKHCLVTCFNTFDHLFGITKLIALNQRFTNWLTLSFQECVSHRATNYETIYDVHKAFDNCDLVRNFCSTHHGQVRTFRICQQRIQHRDFFFNQETNAFVFHDRRQSVDRCVCTVRSTERIVDVDIRVVGDFLRELN
ncbi:hypothetical protein D3C87_1460510 [compost metagenome]